MKPILGHGSAAGVISPKIGASDKLKWRFLLAFNTALMLGYFAYKAHRDFIPIAYIHLLADYHFGLIKRALIGQIVGLWFDQVPPWMVFALGGAVLLATFGCYLKLFGQQFGFSDRTFPLLVFTAGSPFFFKNFIQTVGYFDIYGCLFAIIILLAPARSFGFVIFATAGSVLLILIHHVHMLLYVPTIAVIVVIRYFLSTRLDRAELALGFCCLALVAATFLLMQFGTVNVPLPEFASYLQNRVVDAPPGADPLLFIHIWDRTIGGEIHDTWQHLRSNLFKFPLYLVVLALHIPLIQYGRQSLRLLSRTHQCAIFCGCLLISLGYLVIFATVFDYARWFSNWAVCMLLVLHAAHYLPRRALEASSPIAHNGRAVLLCAVAVSLLPKIGIITPF